MEVRQRAVLIGEGHLALRRIEAGVTLDSVPLATLSKRGEDPPTVDVDMNRGHDPSATLTLGPLQRLAEG